MWEAHRVRRFYRRACTDRENRSKDARATKCGASPVAGASLLRALGTHSRPTNPLQGTSRMWEEHRVPRLFPSGKEGSEVSSRRFAQLCMKGVVPNTARRSPNPVRLPHSSPNTAQLWPTAARCYCERGLESGIRNCASQVPVHSRFPGAWVPGDSPGGTRSPRKNPSGAQQVTEA